MFLIVTFPPLKFLGFYIWPESDNVPLFMLIFSKSLCYKRITCKML